MTPQFQDLMQSITQALAGKRLDAELETWLNTHYGPESEWYRNVLAACRQGVEDGWLCNREHGGIRFGRVIKPAPEYSGFSVDVVDMHDIKGPHHSHPNGEIDLIMPLEGDAKFDGRAAGWKVYGPGSAHYPTVTDGRALVLYLLPEGAIEFTRS